MSDTAVLKTMPCGKANFAVIRERRMAFVDKTRLIETLENCGSDYPFIVRPRRFGKSLTVSMLTAYYDEAAAPQFETTFANTYIGSHKTALASSFRVLHFDFSGLASSAKIAEDFQNRVRDCLIEYFAKYPHPQQAEILNRPFNTAASLISSFFALLAVEEFQKIYVIIDEYDQFANEILSKDLSHFQSITSAQGFLKDFYTCLKSATSKAVARVFITGVTSISLDSMTSGFNIASNLTIDPAFASYVGFTEAELRQFIPQVVDASRCGMTIDEIVHRMQEWYNGYRFSPFSHDTVFNSSLCLYYLNSLQRTGREPLSLLDSNLGQNLEKIEGILRLGDPDFVRQTVEQALRREPIPFSGSLKELNLNEQVTLDEESLLSVMFYLGYLTYAQEDAFSLVIPNRAIRIQFFEYFLKHALGVGAFGLVAKDYVKALASLVAGDPAPIFQVACDRRLRSSGVHDYAQLDESTIKTLIAGAFNLTDAYDLFTELEVRGKDAGFVDIVALPASNSPAKTAYLIELKYLPIGKATDKAIEQAVEKAREQVDVYANGVNICQLPNLKRIIAVFAGLKLVRFLMA